MEKNALNPEAITVESFEIGDSHSLSGLLDCTGCMSGCGIIDEQPYG